MSRIVNFLKNIDKSEVLEILNQLQEEKWIRVTNYESNPIQVTLRGELRKIDKKDLFITKFRELFKGKKMGSMGTLGTVVKNMEEFRATYPEYTTEHILKATESYVKSCANDGYKYLQQADYFIWKNQDFSRVNKTSRLLQWCEEIEENGVKEEVDFSKDA